MASGRLWAIRYHVRRMPRKEAQSARPPGPRAFAGSETFRAWLERHHATAAELLVRCCKNHASDRGLTYRQALEEALCFGWIDGVRRAIDADSFSVRFSPRKAKSRWSAVNVRLATALEKAGRLRPAGLAAFRARPAERPAGYSYESRPVVLESPYLAAFRRNRRAWTFFEKQAPWYRRTTSFWVMSAKREDTRQKRLAILVDCSERGIRLPALTKAKGGATEA